MKVTIKGKEYRLGEVSGSVENFETAGLLIDMDERTSYAAMLPGARRMLHEAIVAGEDEAKATEAMENLTCSVSKDSEFMIAVRALIKLLLA